MDGSPEAQSGFGLTSRKRAAYSSARRAYRSPDCSATLTTTVAGQYSLTLEPDVAAQSGAAGDTITYTLTLSNTGDATTVEVTLAGNAWVVSLPVTSFDLEAGKYVEVVVNMTIPVDAADADSDAVTITATGLGGATDSSVLTTTAVIGTRFVYLPLVMDGYNAP